MAEQGEMRRAKIGLALGSGSARGWAHIGVLRELAVLGIVPDIITGCSMGAIIASASAAGRLDNLEEGALTFTKLDMVKYFELNTALNGFISKERLMHFLDTYACPREQTIEQLPVQFATVSTVLGTGREVWFTQGNVLEAVMASIALPGLLAPVYYQGEWLVDGGLVNPVPVSLCRALGADIVIAVNLNAAISQRSLQARPVPTLVRANDEHSEPLAPTIPDPEVVIQPNLLSLVSNALRGYSASLFTNNRNQQTAPNMLDAITGSINIMQDKITRSRMAGDPPDILLNPRLADISLLEFYRAQEAIDAGRDSVKRMRHELDALFQA